MARLHRVGDRGCDMLYCCLLSLFLQPRRARKNSGRHSCRLLSDDMNTSGVPVTTALSLMTFASLAMGCPAAPKGLVPVGAPFPVDPRRAVQDGFGLLQLVKSSAALSRCRRHGRVMRLNFGKIEILRCALVPGHKASSCQTMCQATRIAVRSPGCFLRLVVPLKLSIK